MLWVILSYFWYAVVPIFDNIAVYSLNQYVVVVHKRKLQTMKIEQNQSAKLVTCLGLEEASDLYNVALALGRHSAERQYHCKLVTAYPNILCSGLPYEWLFTLLSGTSDVHNFKRKCKYSCSFSVFSTLQLNNLDRKSFDPFKYFKSIWFSMSFFWNKLC